MTNQSGPTCAWVETGLHDSPQREAHWVLEVHGADGDIRQRLATCNHCAKDHFRQMKNDLPMVGDSYPVLRRLLPSDAVLTFDSLAVED